MEIRKKSDNPKEKFQFDIHFTNDEINQAIKIISNENDNILFNIKN